jgi:lysophospholipase L1-like esterase
VTSYDEMRGGAPHHGYFNNAWQPFTAQSDRITHIGVTVGNPNLPAGVPVGSTITIRLCDAQPDVNGNCSHVLGQASQQITNYGNTYADLGDIAVTKGATYWPVWFQPAAANGATWVTYWWAGGATISSSDQMQMLVRGFNSDAVDPNPPTTTTTAAPAATTPTSTTPGSAAPTPQRHHVANATIPVNLRAGPGTTFAIVGTASPGSDLDIVCQTTGTNVSGSPIWDQLAGGPYISDYYTDTPVYAAFSPGFTQCDAPQSPSAPTSYRYRVAGATIPVNLRSSPDASSQSVGIAAPNSDLDIVCQTVGSNVNGSSIWDKLASGAYISDYWTSTPVYAGYSPGIPHCPGAPDTIAPPPPAGQSSPWTITAQLGLTVRQGAPRLTAPSAGTLGYGAPVAIECQTAGDNVGGSVIWDRISGDRYISDYWINTPVYGAYTSGIPRCAGSPDVSGPTGSGGTGGGGGPTGGGAGAPYGLVSLGDSFSSGEGAPDDGDGGHAFWENQTCHRSRIAWPRQVASRIGQPLRLFPACSGATMSALTGGFKGQTAQLDQLRSIGQDVKYVTVTIGGNDVLFAPLAAWCLAAVACDVVPGAAQNLIIDAQRSGLAAHYRAILAAAPNAKVFVVGYPRFYSGGGSTNPTCLLLSPPERSWINGKIDRLNHVIQDAVQSINVHRLLYVSMADAFDGRGQCAANSLMNPPISLVDPFYSFHPNRNGQGRMTDLIAPRIQ